MKKKPHICYVGNINSIHLQKWLSQALNNGYKVSLISNVRGVFTGVEVFYINTSFKNRRFLKLLKYPFLFVKIGRLISRLNPDIVHVHYIDLLGTFAAFSGTKPTIISVWGSDVRYAENFSQIKRFIFKSALKKANSITASSKFLAKETSRYTSNKIEIVPFGVDTSLFRPKNNNRRLDGNIRIGFAKNLKPIYGAHVLIEAFSYLTNKNQNIELIMVGDGEEKANLINLTKSLNVHKRVRFLGSLRNKQMPKFLAELDLFVMPTLVEEALGVAALEASAMKIPIVASNIGGVGEAVINNETGILVKPNNIQDLSKVLMNLIQRPSLREKLGSRGRDFVINNYDWNKNALEMRKIYEQIFKKRNI